VNVNGRVLTPAQRAAQQKQLDSLKDGAAVEIRNARKMLLDKMAAFKKNLRGFKAQLGREALAPMLQQFKDKLNEEIQRYHAKVAYLQESLQTQQDIAKPAPPVALPVPEVVPGAPIGKTTTDGQSYGDIVPLYHYFNTRLSDSYYTTNFNVLRTGIRQWEYKGITSFVYRRQTGDSIPLYKFWNLKTGDHRYATVRAVPAGYVFKGITCYIDKKQSDHTVELRSYLDPTTGDSMVTTDYKEVGAGYRLQSIEGYVFPPKYIMNPTDSGAQARRTPLLVPLYRYFNARAADHFYSTNWKELNGAADTRDWTYEGIAGMVLSAYEPGTVPLYRMWNVRTLDHYLTVNKDSIFKPDSPADDNNGWKSEGIEAFVYPYRQDGTLPLYRYYNAEIKDHFYTTSSGDLGFGKAGYTFQGVTAFIHPPPPQLAQNLPAPTITFAPTPLYRYWKPTTNDHFYSTKTQLPVTQMRGWIPQGVVASTYTEQVPGTVPLYRYYNAQDKDHLYTTKKFASGKGGFVAEGVEAFVRAVAKPGWVPLFRFFNPKLKDHFYTTNAREMTLEADKSYRLGNAKGFYYYGISCYVLPSTLPMPGTLGKVYAYHSSSKHESTLVRSKTPGSGAGGARFKGIAFYVLNAAAHGAVPLHHYHNAEYNDNIYSPKVFTAKSNGWTAQKDIGYVFTEPTAGTVPVYLFFNSRVNDHVFTTSKSEFAKGTSGYTYGGIGGWKYYGAQFYTYAHDTASPASVQ
jgi:hypothetical protein